MTDFCEIHWTCGSIDEARKISRYLVQEKLVACAQIIPWIESIYTWNNQLETEQESKIVFKTLKQNFEKIEEIILANCNYEVPEIICIGIERGNSNYMDWVQANSVGSDDMCNKS